MKPLYVPILKAKKGEFDALSHLPKTAGKLTMPLLDIPKPKGDVNRSAYLIKKAEALGKAWEGREIFFDMSSWPEDAKTDDGEHVLLAAWKGFSENGVIAHPVIGFDRWDSPEYAQAIRNILAESDLKVCIRLDLDAISDISLVDEVIESINDYLNLQFESTFVLLDLEDIASASLEKITPLIFEGIDLLKSRGFSKVILAGSSMPNSVTFISGEYASKLVTRKELILWKTVFSSIPDANIYFGDYGVRNPRTPEDVPNPNTNGKIRYTINGQFFIVRGHALSKPPKYDQYYKLAKMVVTSQHYLGASFSWGDEYLLNCSNETISTGNQTTWIGVDTNHHLVHVLAELNEFIKLQTKKPIFEGL